MAELNLELLRKLRTPINSPDRKPITTPEAVKGGKRISSHSLNMELLKKLRTPIQSPDMAEADSSRGIKRINTLDENITGTADSPKSGLVENGFRAGLRTVLNRNEKFCALPSKGCISFSDGQTK